MELKQNIRAIIHPAYHHGYVAECLDIAVVTQGDTLDEVVRNLGEAVAMHLEDQDPTQFGLVDKPSLLVTFELQPEFTYENA